VQKREQGDPFSKGNQKKAKRLFADSKTRKKRRKIEKSAKDSRKAKATSSQKTVESTVAFGPNPKRGKKTRGAERPKKVKKRPRKQKDEEQTKLANVFRVTKK